MENIKDFTVTEQLWGDVAGKIDSNFSEVTELASESKETAESASQTASEASIGVEGVKTEIENIKKNIVSLQTSVGSAEGTAGDAKKLAEAASTAAEEANNAATHAKTVAEGASETANEAKSAAESAKEVALSANETAMQANEKAELSSSALYENLSTKSFLTETKFEQTKSEESVTFETTLRDGEIIPMNGYMTLTACYTCSSENTKIGLNSEYGEIIDNEQVGSGERKVTTITKAHTGLSSSVKSGGTLHITFEGTSSSNPVTLHWAVLYESDEYGNPRRRGGSLRDYYEKLICGFDNWENPKYNENTGLWEMNYLTDLTWEDMSYVAGSTPFNPGVISFKCYNNKLRTNLSALRHSNNVGGSHAYMCYYNNTDGFEVFAYCKPAYVTASFNDNNHCFDTCPNLRAILAYFTPSDFSIVNSPKVETVYFVYMKSDVTIMSDYISYDSLKRAISSASNSSAITIKVTQAVYSKLSGSTVENWGRLATLASVKNITLLAKGDTGYPFLTEVLWHSYAALQKKINDAANGSTIYIHTKDKQKITSSQQDNWGTLVTLAAEKNITFAQAE